MRSRFRFNTLLIALFTATVLPAMHASADEAIRVTYAGSMGVVMDKFIGPSFAGREHLSYQGQGQGAYGMARLLAAQKSWRTCLSRSIQGRWIFSSRPAWSSR